MKIKFGSLVVDGRGKIGGHVASKNRGGAYLRTKVSPINPQSTRQSAVRSQFTGYAQGFRGLSLAEIAAWNAAVANFTKTDIFGDIKSPSGINLYVKLNMNLEQVGGTPLTNPPLPGAVPSVDTVSLVADSSPQAFTVTFTPTPVPADTAFIVEATPGVSAGKSFVKSEFRQIGFYDAADTSPQADITNYTAVFGALTAGQKVFVRLTPVNKLTGQRGLGLTTSTIVL